MLASGTYYNRLNVGCTVRSCTIDWVVENFSTTYGYSYTICAHTELISDVVDKIGTLILSINVAEWLTNA